MTLVNISSKVRKEDMRVSSAALFNVLLIAVMFTLLGSRFIVATGVGIDLTAKTLPDADSLGAVLVDADLSVLNAKGNAMLIFDGAIFNIDGFKKRMKSEKTDGGVLLIKADRSVDAQTLLNICEAAREGGFTKVQIAATPSQE